MSQDSATSGLKQQLQREKLKRQAAQQELHASEERFLTQYQSIPIPTYTWQDTPHGLILKRFNQAAKRLNQEMGPAGDGACGEVFINAPPVKAAIVRCLREQTIIRQEIGTRSPAGAEKHFTVNSAFVPPNVVLVYLEDITERKQAEQALQAAHDKLERRVKERTAALVRINEELQLDICQRQQAEEALRQSEAKFRALAESTSAAIFIAHKERYVYVNPAWETLTGYSAQEAATMTYWAVIHPDMQVAVKRLVRTHPLQNRMSLPFEAKLRTRGGAVKWVDYVSTPIDYSGQSAILGSGFDITLRKQTEDALRDKERQLQQQAAHLEEVNTALKILLEYRDKERLQLEKNMLMHVRKLVLPYIERLEQGQLEGRNRTYLGILKANLEEVISPFASHLLSGHHRLTPAEIQIADLIKQGKTSKEIAALLDVSVNAVSFHRGNIRKKLGLANEKINLRSHLLTLSSAV